MQRLLPVTIAVAIALVIVLVVALDRVLTSGGDAPSSTGPSDGWPSRAHVERVVDGDTLIVRSDGKRVRVRVIGVDTPEDVKPDTPVECWSRQAAAFTRPSLGGRDVLLTPGRERFDRYGRTRAYVERDDGFGLEDA